MASQADLRKFEQQAAVDAQNNQIGKDTTPFAPNFDYIASTFESGKYNVKGLSYPEDLMSSPQYNSSRVIFYINTSVDSRVFKTGSQVTTVEGVQRDLRSQLLGQKVSTAQAAGAAAATGGATGGVVTQALGVKGGTGVVVGAAVGVGGTAAIANSANNAEVPEGQKKEPTFSRPQKRLKAAIALYIPNQLSARYSAGWGEEDTSAFSMLAKVGGEIGKTLTGNADVKRTGGVAGEILAALAINNAPMGKEMALAAGVAANPKKEQAFKNVDFRTFTFEYQFAPRSESEALNVQNIIRAFKYHMHPEFKSSDAFLYIYPSEFDIVYYQGTEENLNIHRHTSCVLTEMNVNYTPNGVFNTFPNGMPTQINLTLTFKELMLLSKETIEKYT
jgi:hypothetical protein